MPECLDAKGEFGNEVVVVSRNWGGSLKRSWRIKRERQARLTVKRLI